MTAPTQTQADKLADELAAAEAEIAALEREAREYEIYRKAALHRGGAQVLVAIDAKQEIRAHRMTQAIERRDKAARGLWNATARDLRAALDAARAEKAAAVKTLAEAERAAAEAKGAIRRAQYAIDVAETQLNDHGTTAPPNPGWG
jgi:hypothetical protein